MRPPPHPTVTYANRPKGAGASRASSSPAPRAAPTHAEPGPRLRSEWRIEGWGRCTWSVEIKSRNFFLFSFSFSFSFCPCAQETKQAHDSPPHISTQEPWDFRYTLWCQLYMSSWNLNSVPHACKASILSTERPPQAKTVVFQHVSSYLGLHCNEF